MHTILFMYKSLVDLGYMSSGGTGVRAVLSTHARRRCCCRDGAQMPVVMVGSVLIVPRALNYQFIRPQDLQEKGVDRPF